jgi:hypothetical protein
MYPNRREFMHASASLAAIGVTHTGVAAGVSQPVLETAVYAIDDAGDMYYYLHGDATSGAARWKVQSLKIGNGWNFEHVFAGVGDAIYAAQPGGDLYF